MMRKRDKKSSSLHYGGKSPHSSGYNTKGGHSKTDPNRHNKKKHLVLSQATSGKFTAEGNASKSFDRGLKRPRDERSGDPALNKSANDLKRDRCATFIILLLLLSCCFLTIESFFFRSKRKAPAPAATTSSPMNNFFIAILFKV